MLIFLEISFERWAIWLWIYCKNVREVNFPIFMMVVSSKPRSLSAMLPSTCSKCAPTRLWSRFSFFCGIAYHFNNVVGINVYPCFLVADRADQGIMVTSIGQNVMKNMSQHRHWTSWSLRQILGDDLSHPPIFLIWYLYNGFDFSKT